MILQINADHPAIDFARGITHRAGIVESDRDHRAVRQRACIGREAKKPVAVRRPPDGGRCPVQFDAALDHMRSGEAVEGPRRLVDRANMSIIEEEREVRPAELEPRVLTCRSRKEHRLMVRQVEKVERELVDESRSRVGVSQLEARNTRAADDACLV
jgi:hypothetical protein